MLIVDPSFLVQIGFVRNVKMPSFFFFIPFQVNSLCQNVKIIKIPSFFPPNISLK